MKKQNNNSQFRPPLIMTIVAVCLVVYVSFWIYSMVKDYGWFGGYEAGMTLNEMEAVPSGWFKRSVKRSIKEHSENTPQNEEDAESFIIVPTIEHISHKWNVDGCYEFDSDMVVNWIELRYIYFKVPTPEECGEQTADILSEFVKERGLDAAKAVSFTDYKKAYEYLQQRQLLRMMPSSPPNMLPLAPSNQTGNLSEEKKPDFFALYYWEHDGKRTSFSAVRNLSGSDTPEFILFFTEAVSAASENSQNTNQNMVPSESAETEPEPTTASLRDLPSARFSLSESFYDGSTLILAYDPQNMIYPVEFGYSPDDIENLNYMGRWYINTGWQDIIFPEDYEHIEKILREEEQCGFVLRYIYLGDHVRLTDGTDLGPWAELNDAGTVVRKWSEEASALPNEAKGRDALDLVLTIREVLVYHYKDGENYYYGSESLGEKTVTVTVGRFVSENGHVQGPDELSGAAAIRQYYLEKAEKDTTHDYSHMDLSTLDGLASGTIGNVVDTDELSIDVMGAVISRNAAEIILRITAKQLDTLVYDNGIPPLSNYRFRDETALFGRQTFGEKAYSVDHWYTYSQSEGRLAGNQCELHYFIRYPEPLETDNLIIPLTDFGYYKTAAEFVPVYENTWQVSIANDALSDSSRMIGGEREITVGDYRMSVEDITVSPLMCSFRLVCLEDEAVTGENMSSMINACFSEKDRFFLTLADGTILDGTQLDIGGSVVQQYPLIFTWTLPYPGPLNVDTVSAVTIFDWTIPFR